MAFSRQALECRLEAGYNDVKVRRDSRTRRLSDGEAGTLGRAGVKCRSLKNLSFASAFFLLSFPLYCQSFHLFPLFSFTFLRYSGNHFSSFHFLLSCFLCLLSPPFPFFKFPPQSSLCLAYPFHILYFPPFHFPLLCFLLPSLFPFIFHFPIHSLFVSNFLSLLFHHSSLLPYLFSCKTCSFPFFSFFFSIVYP